MQSLNGGKSFSVLISCAELRKFNNGFGNFNMRIFHVLKVEIGKTRLAEVLPDFPQSDKQTFY
jgi:hypothetical protein